MKLTIDEYEKMESENLEIEKGNCNSVLLPSDWRYSASILGLYKFFKFLDEKTDLDCKEKVDYFLEEDYFIYNDKYVKCDEESDKKGKNKNSSKDKNSEEILNDERNKTIEEISKNEIDKDSEEIEAKDRYSFKKYYAKFVEDYYKTALHHVYVENKVKDIIQTIEKSGVDEVYELDLKRVNAKFKSQPTTIKIEENEKTESNVNNNEKVESSLEEKTDLKEENENSSKEVSDKVRTENISGNTIMEKTFKHLKFDLKDRENIKETAENILDTIEKNRVDITIDTFKNKNDMYKNFCNPNSILLEKDFSKVVGYYEDAGKKSKSVGFFLDKSTFVGGDHLEFDFIPFAFVGNRESFFINDNMSLKKLKSTNKIFNDNINKEQKSKYVLFDLIMGSERLGVKDFLEHDVEIIAKDQSLNYFETVILRSCSIKTLKNISELGIETNSLKQSIKINENYYIDVYSKTIDAIINSQEVIDIIEVSLKKAASRTYRNLQLIKINYLIRKGDSMDSNTLEDFKKDISKVHGVANEIIKKLEENALTRYRNKLISSMVARDKDKVFDIFMKISMDTGVYLSFLDTVLLDFEDNKELIYAFINALGKQNYDKNKLDA
ncbi:MAG: type I CRISPR-associated protein Cas8a1/Csx8 [Clostridioides sp.]|jgi:CRISPR-associated protein Cst1|nr:type I CRISPR-associated protein Cas8a1/Csx8 [Clostridioides sp.]